MSRLINSLKSYIYIYICIYILVAIATPLLTINSPALADSASTTFNVEVSPTLAMTLSANSATLDLHPTKDGALSNATVSVTTGTNNEFGYTLTMNATSTDLTNSAASSTIPTLSSATNYDSSFPANQWGYSILSQASPTVDTTTVFNPLATTSTLSTTSSASNADVITLALAAKADINLPSGVYNNTLQFMAVTNLPPCDGELLGGVCVEYLQDFYNADSSVTTAIKNAMTSEQQYQFKDKRDNKTYYVAKLKDGNVWMTQNLDFNISTTNVKAADSDVTADWTTSSTYKPVATLTNASSYTSSTNTAVQSWDAGNYYYNGTSSTSCGSGKTTYSGCTGFSTSGNAHYHVGNMYSWNAATAGTGGTITSGQASGSICPKGWRLPMSSGSPSFADLQSKASLGSTVQNWLNAPYYFVRGGSLWYDSDKLYLAGSNGIYWSSTPYSDSRNAYYLYFDSSSNVFPANRNYYRALGMSVRCVAR